MTMMCFLSLDHQTGLPRSLVYPRTRKQGTLVNDSNIPGSDQHNLSPQADMSQMQERPACSGEQKNDLLCELNVIEQVANICRTTVVRGAWKSGQELAVHGWIYGIEDGILKDLDVCIASLDEISRVERIK